MKLPYSEGSVFLVPLCDGGYCRGVVARSRKRGKILCGYFFGPRLESAASATLQDLSPANAIRCIMCGDLGLINGQWPVIGSVPNWDRTEWRMPDFVRRDIIFKRAWLVRYADDDPSRIETQVPTSYDCELEANGVAGYRYVEQVLSRAL